MLTSQDSLYPLHLAIRCMVVVVVLMVLRMVVLLRLQMLVILVVLVVLVMLVMLVALVTFVIVVLMLLMLLISLVVVLHSPPGQTDHWTSQWDDSDTYAGGISPSYKSKLLICNHHPNKSNKSKFATGAAARL